MIPRQVVSTMGAEIERPRETVPLSLAHSLRNISIKHKSFMAVDKMYCTLGTYEVQLAVHIPPLYYDIYKALCRAARLLFRLRGLSAVEHQAVDKDLMRFVPGYYTHIYRGSFDRFALCRSIVTAVLDVATNRDSCGPANVRWQVSAERKIGSLTQLIRSHSKPHANLAGNVSRQYKDEIIGSFGQKYAGREWAHSTGKAAPEAGFPCCSFVAYVPG